MKLPAISIHAENLQLRTKVQLLETKLANCEKERKKQVGLSFLLNVLISLYCSKDSIIARKADELTRKTNGVRRRDERLH